MHQTLLWDKITSKLERIQMDDIDESDRVDSQLHTEYLFSMMLFSNDHTSFVQKLNDAFLNVTVVKCSRIETLISCHILFGKIITKILCVHFL